MIALLAVGVGRWADLTGDYDLWLPVLVLLAFVLVRVVARLGINWRTSIAAIAGGTLWSWATDWVGVIAASAAAVLIAFIGGEIVLHADAARRRRGTR